MAKFYEKKSVIKTGQVRKAYEDDNRSTVTKSMNVRNAVPPRSQTFLENHLSMTGRMTQELSANRYKAFVAKNNKLGASSCADDGKSRSQGPRPAMTRGSQ